MSKLADKIRSAGRVAPAPIGFGVAMERRASPTLLCLLRLDKNQVKSVGDAAAAGADAVIITDLALQRSEQDAADARPQNSGTNDAATATTRAENLAAEPTNQPAGPPAKRAGGASG